MIVVHGTSDGGSEYSAAEALAKAACEAMPEVSESKQIVLELFPKAQCFGQKIRDIDLLVFFADYRAPENQLISADGKKVHSFCLSIEVKAHSAEAVIFEGANCYVNYNNQEHDVTGQSEGQKYSLKKYIDRNSRSKSSPWISNLIWLMRVPSNLMPAIDSNILGANFSWVEFINKISLLDSRKNGNIETFSSRQWMDEIMSVFSRRLLASKIDRKRLEAITKRVLDRTQQQYAEKLGQQLLIFRGRGGTGKTVKLLQIGNQACDEYGLRVILLTYNKALVADISRLLALRGIRNSIGESGMSVQTIHSFMHEWLCAVGVIQKKCSDFLEKYGKYKLEALELIKQGAISEEDIRLAKTSRSRDLAWDLILIDESQDWPQSERDLIYSLYDYKKVVIADGVDQFVRGVTHIDWREGISTANSQIVALRKSLRLKSTLCQTVGHFAEAIELQNWNLEPVPESHGGKVIVVIGNALSEEFHRRLIATSNHDGNKPIDMLLCVPPTWVKNVDDGRESVVARAYLEWGYEVWDAVDPRLRGEHATSLEQFRIVQYESCRGLEGWVVVCFALDEFFDYKKENAEISDESKLDVFYEESDAALEYAKKWLMIPLTRAIDTLVLHVSDKDSYVGTVLQNLHAQYADDIIWLEYE